MDNLPHNCKAETCAKPAYKRDDAGQWACVFHIIPMTGKCSRGHEMVSDNIMLTKEGWKRCRKCQLKAKRKYIKRAKK